MNWGKGWKGEAKEWGSKFSLETCRIWDRVEIEISGQMWVGNLNLSGALKGN